MLLLTRKPGENILLGEDILICVKSVSGNSVRIGVQAPRSVSVFREEIYQARKEASVEKAPKEPSGQGAEEPDDE